MNPKYLVRLEDYSVFSINEDGHSYSSHYLKTYFPTGKHNQWSLSTLKERGFVVCEEAKVNSYSEKERQYYSIDI